MEQPSDQDKQRFGRAMEELNNGDASVAIQLFEKVRSSWRDDPDILYLEGLAYGKIGRPDDVKKVSEQALALNSGHFGALCNLANAQMLLGDADSALENYNLALEAKPDAPDVLDNYGRALSLLGRREEAIEHFRKALESRADFAPAHSSLAQAYAESGEPAAAVDEYMRALQIDPRDYNAHCGIAGLYAGGGGLAEAASHYREAINIQKQQCNAYIGLANVERYKGNIDLALDLLNQAQEITSDDDPLIAAFKSDCYERQGKLEEAYKILNDLAENNLMSPTAVSAYSRICRHYDKCDQALELINDSIERPATNSMQKQDLLYSAGSLLNRLGRYDEAFEYYVRANEEIPAPAHKDHEKEVDKLIGFFSEETLNKLPRAQTGSTRPIFILGMPRSGTSLTEQILASHPDVYGAGELNELKKAAMSLYGDNTDSPTAYLEELANCDEEKITGVASQYLNALQEIDSTAKYVTDKLPHNFLYVGLISLLFPEARIIHCRRNPLDTGLSIFFQSFIWAHDYATDLAQIGAFYSQYERLMRHWQKVVKIPMLDVHYEDMVDDQEGISRKILEFCNLEWDDSVMHFHQHDRTVATASYDQVRQPLYKSSKARWKNYARHLKPLKDALPAHSTLGIEDIELIDKLSP